MLQAGSIAENKYQTKALFKPLSQLCLLFKPGVDRTGQDGTGQDRTGQDRTGQDRTGKERTEKVFKRIIHTFL
jgi:hypothetical protein